MLRKSIFIIIFSFLVISCSQSNITSSAIMEPTEKNVHNTWLKVKYDIETDGQVTNIELVDSYKASHKVKVDTINVIRKWNFPKSNAKNGNIVIIYFRPAPSV